MKLDEGRIQEAADCFLDAGDEMGGAMEPRCDPGMGGPTPPDGVPPPVGDELSWASFLYRGEFTKRG